LLELDRMPPYWCPGCGLTKLLISFVRVLSRLDLNASNCVTVHGIGDAGRFGYYLKLDSVHTPHGRAIPVAEGIKIAKPELTVIVVSGDGDLLSIGANHLVHAARRNLDITVVCANNFVFGMTGGQLSPTTPAGFTSSTGIGTRPLNVPRLLTKGNVYAKASTFDRNDLEGKLEAAIRWPAFSFLEVICPCVDHFRRIGLDPREVNKYLEQDAVRP